MELIRNYGVDLELWSWFGTMELVWNYGVGMELWKWLVWMMDLL